MIGYRVDKKKLEGLVDGHAPKWRTKAAERTKDIKKNGKAGDHDAIWGEVKDVWMALQGKGKCAFCERKLEFGDFGGPEQDVEHYRPKNRITPWPTPAMKKDPSVKDLLDALAKLKQKIVTPSPTAAKGYPQLALNMFNYTASCKPCNEVLKRDYFPIAGTYRTKADDPVAMLAQEKPFLIFPVGDFDDDPEDLITFVGATPAPKKTGGHNRARALVTIEFFKLHDPIGRKNLYHERAMAIVAFYAILTNTTLKAAAKENLIKVHTSPECSHANCLRSFRDLFRTDPTAAQAVFEAANDYLPTTS